MRLLKASGDDFELISVSDDSPPPYAILSHTWTEGQEVTYDEVSACIRQGKTGFDKIRFCLNRAAQDDLGYCWVDTCCINKSTSDELSTAINSMFRYYQRARKCYVYLTDVFVSPEVVDPQDFRISWIQAFRQSRWFTRGWTLQELLAPASVEFFSKDGRRLGSRISLEQDIHTITQIPVEALRGRDIREFSVEERMSWAASRTTTLKEDKVYCLLGIFGVFLSLIYGEGEEHANLRLREEIEKRQEKRQKRLAQDPAGRSQGPPKPCSNVPFRKDDDFVDRGDILASIDERCSRPAGRAALVGFGGFGYVPSSLHLTSAKLHRKSQLAIEYAHRVQQKSPETWVFWVHASNSARVEAAFSEIADRIGLSSRGTAADIVTSVRKWLCTDVNGRWLMIVDNADTEIVINLRKEEKVSLETVLPQSGNGAILITSRNADIARKLVGRERDLIAIGTMSEDEAVSLLQNKLGEDTVNGTAELVNAVDRIPLAIVQAAAYINRLKPRISVAKYLNELKAVKQQAQLLRRAASDMRRDEQASNSVLMTWQVSFDYIKQRRSSASGLLSFMSFFNRQGIPEFMVRNYAYNHSEDQDKEVEGDIEEEKGEEEDDNQSDCCDDTFEQDIAVLRSFSLVDTKQHEGGFEMHGLVQLATRLWLKSTNAERKWHQLFIKAMAQEFPNGEYENWSKCRTLFPHVLLITEQEYVSEEAAERWAFLLHNVGWYAWQQGLFAQAEGIIQKALDKRKIMFGADDLSTIQTMSLVGCVLKDLGKYAEAESVNRHALAKYINVLGIDHPDTLTAMNNLAIALHKQSKYTEAELIHRQTLAAREKVLGVDHPQTLEIMNNLAIVLDNQGKYAEAESMHRQTLAAREKVLGVNHPDTLATMNNLAIALHKQSKYTEGELIYKQTLAAREKVLGVDHPQTLEIMNNLAIVLDNQGKYAEAESMHRQTLAATEKVLGVNHPDTLGIMNNLAIVLRRQNKYAEAESIHRQTLAAREKVLGVNHPDTLATMNNLTIVLDNQGKYAEAESMHRQTLAAREKVLGVDQQDTLNSIYSLAHLLSDRHRFNEADPLYQRACAGYDAILGEDHPTTRACHQDYANALALQKQAFLSITPAIPPRDVSVETGKRSNLSRGLAKLGINKSKFSRHV